MSEPQTNPGSPSLFSATVKGEKAGSFEEQFEDETVSEEPAEATEPEVEAAAKVEQPEAEEAAPEGETPEDKLVRETTERLKGLATDQAAPAVPQQDEFLRGLQEVKDQVARLGKVQQAPEATDEIDTDFMNDPGVQRELQKARDSEEPGAWEQALAVVAQYAARAEKGKAVDEVKQELDNLKRATLQQRQLEYNQQRFAAGIEAAKSVGGMEASLVKQFEETREMDHWRAHVAKHGPSLENYNPQSLLGAWLMYEDPETGFKNAVFTGTPELMQAGVMKLAREIKSSSGVQPETEVVSTTGAGARVRSSSASKDMLTDSAEASPEEAIWGAIEAANKKRKSKAKAFQ